jgi:hypothetical protein
MNKLFPHQIPFYFAYNQKEDIDIYSSNVIDKVIDFMYIGNDYKRRDKMIKFYSSINCHIYGKYDTSESEVVKLVNTIGKDKFKGPCNPDWVVKLLSTARACIHIARPEYETIGHIAPRVNECANAGTLLFMDKDIKDADKFTLPDQVISTAKEAQQKLKDILADGSYNKRIEKQRAMLPTYRQQMPRIYDMIKQNKGKLQ